MSGLERRQTALLLLLALVGVIIYSNTFQAPFHFDDITNIVENPVVKSSRYFLYPSRVEGLPHGEVFRSRYVGYLSFALNYGLHGLHVAGYHVVNVAVHIMNAALVFLLVVFSFRTPALAGASLGKRSHSVALAAGFLFLTHPVQTQAVTYVIQRFASLAAFFYLASLVCYIRWRLDGRSSLYEVLFFRGSGRKRLRFLAPLLLTMLIIPVTLLTSERPAGEIIGHIGEAARLKSEMSRLDYLMTQFRVIFTYLRLIVLPVNQNLDYDYPVFSSLLSTGVLVPFLLLAGLLCSAGYLLLRARGERRVLLLAGFGIVWFFLALSVESSVVPIRDVAFEHRVYLPLAGISILAAAGMFSLAESLSSGRRRAILGVFVATVAVLSLLTYERNRLWGSGISLWEDVVRKSPYKARGYNNLGNRYAEQERYEQAAEHYGYAVLISPEYHDYWVNRGTAYLHMGKYDKAIKHFKETLKREPGMAEAYNNLCHIYYKKDLLDEAEENCLRALKIKPDLVEARGNLNRILERRANPD
jgi:hypothetical protein